MLSRRHLRWHCDSLAQRLLSPSDPTTSPKSAAYKVPYFLPSSEYSNSFVFTLFSKLPGCTSFLLYPEQCRRAKTELGASQSFTPIFERQFTPSRFPLFSTTYEGTNLQALSSQIFTTLGWVGGGRLPCLRAVAGLLVDRPSIGGRIIVLLKGGSLHAQSSRLQGCHLGIGVCLSAVRFQLVSNPGGSAGPSEFSYDVF